MLIQNAFHSDFHGAKELRLSKLTPAYSTASGAMFHVNAIELLHKLPSNSVDLVMTSPPFALTRQKEYGNEPFDKYLEWFMPFCLEIKRILKANREFCLRHRRCVDSRCTVRSVYHFELAVKLAKEFFLAQEFYCYNPARLPTPAEWVTVRRLRVKDSVNMVWWFGKSKWPNADNRRILQPYSESMKDLIKNGYKAKKRPSGHDISTEISARQRRGNSSESHPNCKHRIKQRYLRKCKDRGIKPHPARYPERLVKFFVDFLTSKGELIVDPFAGSNVTGSVCEQTGRRWLASEIESRYIEGSMLRFEIGPLFDAKVEKPNTNRKHATTRS